MKLYVQTAFITPANLLQVARRSEEIGYYGITVADHLMLPRSLASDYPYGDAFPDGELPFPDPWVAISAMAAVTSRLHFASAVYLALLHPPVVVAKAVATAAILSRYRVALCIGLGWMRQEYEHVGVDFATRANRHDEMVELVREIWKGNWVHHHGTYYDYEPFRLAPAPTQPIPIWGAGHAEGALRRSARLDGWIGANPDIDELPPVVARLKRYRAEAGLDPEDGYEIMSGLKDKVPTRDEILRLEEAGVTSLWIHPWAERNTDGDPGLDVVLRSLETYGERVLDRL